MAVVNPKKPICERFPFRCATPSICDGSIQVNGRKRFKLLGTRCRQSRGEKENDEDADVHHIILPWATHRGSLWAWEVRSERQSFSCHFGRQNMATAFANCFSHTVACFRFGEKYHAAAATCATDFRGLCSLVDGCLDQLFNQRRGNAR